MYEGEKSKVRTEAQRERDRIERQAEQARQRVRDDVAVQRERLAHEARTAGERAEREAEIAKEEAARQAEIEKDKVRQMQSVAERESQAVMSQAREIQSKELRKLDLPVTKPEDLGVQEYIKEVDTARREAHKQGREARGDIVKARDDYFAKVDEARDEALSQIAEQKKGIAADIAKSLVKAEAEIAKQYATLLSGVSEWEGDALAKLEVAQLEYEKAVKAVLDRPGEEIFEEMQAEGKIPEGAIYESYNKTTGEVHYKLPDTRSIETIFAELKATGKIPENAIFKGFDTETNEFEYTIAQQTYTPQVLAEIEKEFLALDELRQRAMISSQVQYLPPWKVRKDVKEQLALLSPEQRERVLIYYNESVRPIKTAEDFKIALKHEIKAWGEFYVSLVPIAGTIYFWDDMSPAWKAISIALDVAVLVPAIKAGISALRVKIRPVTTRVAQLIKIETNLARQMASKLNVSYGKSVASAYTKMTQAQTRYLKRLAQIEELVRKGKPIPSRLNTSLIKLETSLRNSARAFTTKLQPLAGFDSPEIARMVNTLPDDMVRNAKAAIAGLQITNLKALREAVKVAEKALRVTQAKYPAEPSKWVDKLYNLAMAKSKLYQANTGAITELYDKLLTTRKAGDISKSVRLERELARAINNMEVEWYNIESRFAPLTKGSGVTIIETRPITPTKYTSPLKISTTTKSSAVRVSILPRLLAVPSELREVKPVSVPTPEIITKTTPEVIEIAKVVPEVKGVTDVEIINLSKIAYQVATEAITRDMTDTGIRVVVEEAVKTQAKAATKTQVKTITKVAIKVALRVATKIKPRILPSLPDIGAEGAPDRKKYPDGTITWKMGVFWKIIPPPYNLEKPINSKSPPVGVKVRKGTPQQTLTFIGGKLPFKNVSFDLGVVDGFIDVKKKRIIFSGEGEKTNVGLRLPSATKGLALQAVSRRKVYPVKKKNKKPMRTVSIGRA